MKKIIYLIALFSSVGYLGCQKAEYLLFNDVARVQMDNQSEIRRDFFYKDGSIQRDTAYLTVNTIGVPENRVRKIALQQISEYDVEYKYDNKGNLIDSVVTEKPYKAVSGVHYVALDAPEMESLLVVKPNETSVLVPIILLRDTSLQTHEYRLCLELVATDDFLLGESEHLSNTIIFADKLSQPEKWDAWITQYQFGKYSERKHAFMYEVAGVVINDEWIDMVKLDMAELSFWKNKFKTSLAEYNNDPDNKNKGLAPMREDQDDPRSPLVTFP